MGRILTLIVGAAIGAGAALLYSPNTGTRNRELVAEKLGGTFDQVQQLIKDPDAAEKGQEFIQEAAESAKPIVSDKNDELREKIEAARKRIAEQIAKNAEGLQDKVVDAEEAADEILDAVEDFIEEAADAADDAKDQIEDLFEGEAPAADEKQD